MLPLSSFTLRCLDSRDSVCSVFVDYRKAFDLVAFGGRKFATLSLELATSYALQIDIIFVLRVLL